MITVRLQIGAEEIRDTTYYGLVYLSSDHRFAAEVKDFDVTTYPEEEGEHIIPRTVDAPFDYTVKFYVKAEGSQENANQKIAAFNSALCTYNNTTKIREYKEVTFFNDYKKVKIVGYPKPISEATDFWRDSSGRQHDVVVVEWTIRVTTPSKCVFNYTEQQQ